MFLLFLIKNRYALAYMYLHDQLNKLEIIGHVEIRNGHFITMKYYWKYVRNLNIVIVTLWPLYNKTDRHISTSMLSLENRYVILYMSVH